MLIVGDCNINHKDLNHLQSEETYKVGIYLRMYLRLVSSPEMKASLILPLGEGRRLFPGPWLWSPCGPQVLPCDVSASSEMVHPLPSTLFPSMAVMNSLSLNSNVSSPPPSLRPLTERFSAQVSPYLKKKQELNMSHLAWMLAMWSPSETFLTEIAVSL